MTTNKSKWSARKHSASVSHTLPTSKNYSSVKRSTPTSTCTSSAIFSMLQGCQNSKPWIVSPLLISLIIVCGSSRPSFVKAFQEMLSSHMDSSNNCIHPFPPIQRLSLHGCQTLPPKVYHSLLPQLPHFSPQQLHLVPPPSIPTNK